jgi:pyrroline-5-carboxylate reductase
MKAHSIAFIGAGNMARSLIGGLIADNWPAERIRVSDTDPGQIDAIRRQFPGVVTSQDNLSNVERADLVLLAVKPQSLKEAAQGLAGRLSTGETLIISIVAGIRSSDLMHWLGGEFAVVRCMPNTPALVGSGATGLFANTRVTAEQRDIAESILRAVGLTIWFDEESQLDAVTALSGSGPAYLFLVMEAMENAGKQLGLTDDAARLLTLQTAFGASKLALESQETVASLRRRVTSPGGTTEKALAVLENGELRNLFERALQAAACRSKELANEFAKG